MEKRTFNKNTSIKEVGYPCSGLEQARKHGEIKTESRPSMSFFLIVNLRVTYI